MSNSKVRSAIHLEPELHRALRMKAELTQRSASEIKHESVRAETLPTCCMTLYEQPRPRSPDKITPRLLRSSRQRFSCEAVS